MNKKALYIFGGIISLLFLKGILKDSREIELHGSYLESIGAPYFEVRYRAETIIPFLCRDFNLFQGSHRETERLRYWPKTTGSYYEVTVPLDKKRWSFICDFQPYSIWVEEQNLFDITPENIAFVKNPYADLTIRETKLVAQDGNKYEIDFGKILKPVERTSWYKRKQQQEKYSSAQRKKRTHQNTKVNVTPADIIAYNKRVKDMRITSEHLALINELFTAVIKSHRRSLGQKEGEALLRLEGDFSPYFGKGISKYDIEELKEKIPRNAKGYLLDVWGNPFRYKAARKGVLASLYSTGKDGLDNGHGLLRNLPSR